MVIPFGCDVKPFHNQFVVLKRKGPMHDWNEKNLAPEPVSVCRDPGADCRDAKRLPQFDFLRESYLVPPLILKSSCGSGAQGPAAILNPRPEDIHLPLLHPTDLRPVTTPPLKYSFQNPDCSTEELTGPPLFLVMI